MRTRIRSLVLMGGLFLLLAVASLLFAAPALADLPPSPCTWDGTTRVCELWATHGELIMPDGEVIHTWGFASTTGVSATVPGPLLLGNEGETMEVTLNNSLPFTVALAFPGQELLPDLVGVPPGGSATYSFILSSPGTFLYEAGLTADGPHQVAMGLYGALVANPLVPGTYDDEWLLVLGEVDPVLNSDPAAFSMHEYAPEYGLINGLAYPAVPEIEVIPGQTVLFRYVNAGLQSHWMGLLGLQQQIIASDGEPLPASYGVVADTIAAGQTVDALVTIPDTAVTDARYALYDTNLLLHNAGQAGTAVGLSYGGMMTFLHVTAGSTAPDVGPLASNVLVSPNPTTGAAGVTLTADFTAGVNAAEFYTNTLAGVPVGSMNDVGGGSYEAFIDAATLTSWPSGFIVFYVRGSDGVTWGPVGSTVLNLDYLGPTISGMSLNPEPTNGSAPVLLRATGDDHATGRNNVITGTYSIDGGTPVTMTLNRTDNPITAMTATLTITELGGLAEGMHPISILAQDSLLNWGTPGVITLTLDQTGPAASTAITLTPAVLDLSGAPPVTSVRLEAVISDALSAGVQSPLANAEGFINPTLPISDGTGFDLFPTDGLFDEITEGVYFDIPIANFLYLAQGDHIIAVHGLDVAGNWGALGEAIIHIDRGGADTEGPAVSALTAAPNPTNGAATVDVAAAAADPNLLSNVAAAEWYVDNDPGPGAGVPLVAVDGAFDSPTELLAAVINVSGWINRDYRLYVRAVDSSGNWGAPASITLTVSNNAAAVILADGFETGTFGAWTAVVGAVSITADAAIAPARSTLGMQADLNADPGEPAYVSHAMPTGESSYQASFWYDPNSTFMGIEEHDIFVGLEAGIPIFGIQYEHSGAGSYQVRAWALAAGTPVYTLWYDIDDAPHQLAVGWASDPASTLYLKVDGAVLEEQTGLDTAAYVVDEVRLGASGELDPAMAGIEYFDEFEAVRQVSIRLFLPIISRSQ